MGKEKKLTGLIPTMSGGTRTILNPFKEVAEFKNGTFHFSFLACLKWMERQGKTLFGDHFRIFTDDHPIIYKLLVYAIADVENTTRQGIDLKKGILLNGPVGVGKSALMTLISFFFPSEKQYQLKPTREINFELEKEGYKVIGKYSEGSYMLVNNQHVPKVWCFDDLGIEQPLKYFGNDCQVMAEILLSRYDLFVSKRMLTHLTTNLSASEIEQRYGNRIRSRMREMFNLIAFDKNTEDKRN